MLSYSDDILYSGHTDTIVERRIEAINVTCLHDRRGRENIKFACVCSIVGESAIENMFKHGGSDSAVVVGDASNLVSISM